MKLLTLCVFAIALAALPALGEDPGFGGSPIGPGPSGSTGTKELVYSPNYTFYEVPNPSVALKKAVCVTYKHSEQDFTNTKNQFKANWDVDCVRTGDNGNECTAKPDAKLDPDAIDQWLLQSRWGYCKPFHPTSPS